MLLVFAGELASDMVAYKDIPAGQTTEILNGWAATGELPCPEKSAFLTIGKLTVCVAADVNEQVRALTVIVVAPI